MGSIRKELGNSPVRDNAIANDTNQTGMISEIDQLKQRVSKLEANKRYGGSYPTFKEYAILTCPCNKGTYINSVYHGLRNSPDFFQVIRADGQMIAWFNSQYVPILDQSNSSKVAYFWEYGSGTGFLGNIYVLAGVLSDK